MFAVLKKRINAASLSLSLFLLLAVRRHKLGKRGRVLRHARLQRVKRRQTLRRGRAARVGGRGLRPQEAGKGGHKGGAARAVFQVGDAGAGQRFLDVALDLLSVGVCVWGGGC